MMIFAKDEYTPSKCIERIEFKTIPQHTEQIKWNEFVDQNTDTGQLLFFMFVLCV